MALFLFRLAKAARVYLPTAHFVALRPSIPIRLGQFVQVFPLKSVLFCKLFAGIGSTNRFSTCFLHLSHSLSFYLSGRVCHLFFAIKQQWVARHSFLPGDDATDKLATRATPTIPYSLSSRIELGAYCLI